MRWGQQTCLCHMGRSAAHGGSPSIPVMFLNAWHAQKCVRGQPEHSADARYSIPLTAMGHFQEQVQHYRSYISSPADQQVSLDFLNAENILSAIAGQTSRDHFHLSCIIFIEILTANCMGMHFLTVNKRFPSLLFNVKDHLTEHEKQEFLPMTVIHM